jgi:pyruvate dehydrogenase E2 component (dihydrolipoamide acetyltransferase)
MAVEIKMPSLGTAVDEVRLINWVKNVGDPVKMGEVIAEVETDKAVTELESYAAGVVLAHLVEADSTVEEGQVIAYVGKEGEEVPGGEQPQEPAAFEPEEPKAPAKGDRATDNLRVSPVIRKLAQREAVDLATCSGSGPSGQILRSDVLAAKDRAPARQASAASQPQPKPGEAPTLSRNQRGVIKRITDSHRQQVPIHLNAYVDMTAAMGLREDLLEKTGSKICFDAIFIHAAARVLEQFPRFSTRMVDDRLVPIEGDGVALAVSPGEELFTPTIRRAGQKSYLEIDRDIRALAQKARDGQITLEEMSDACFTISNLGMYPVASFDMVVPPEQCAALAIGAIEHRITLEQGRLQSAPSVCVTLTCDHRIINGRQAAQMLAALKEKLETI